MLNAASVFFQLHPPYELRTAVFAGATSATILDRQSFKGGILELIEEAQRYILKNIHIGMKVEGLERIDVPEIHPEAIREAVINAFCHRDYRDPDPVQIAIYQDRVEIRNPGTLIERMTLEDLRRGTVSRRRNPVIAELLRRIRLVESWGRGIPLILEKAPDTQFTIQAGLFVSILQRSEKKSDVAQKTSKSSENAALDTTQKTTQKTSGKTSEKTSEKILKIVHDDNQVTIAELSEQIGVTTRTIERNLKLLQSKGQLQRIGPDKGGEWRVIVSGSSD